MSWDIVHFFKKILWASSLLSQTLLCLAFHSALAQEVGDILTDAQSAPLYQLLERFRDGGTGQTFLAKDLREHKEVALKFLPQTRQEGSALWGNQRQVEALGDIDIQGLMPIQIQNLFLKTDIGDVKILTGVRSELAQAFSDYKFRLLVDPRVTYRDGSRNFPGQASALNEVWKYASDLLTGVAMEAAVGLVHGDIKPDNVLRDGKGNYRLNDYDAVNDLGSPKIARSTPTYRSMEAEFTKTSPETELWSLGLTVTDVLSGRQLLQEFLTIEGLYVRPSDPNRIGNAKVTAVLKFFGDRRLQQEFHQRVRDYYQGLEAKLWEQGWTEIQRASFARIKDLVLASLLPTESERKEKLVEVFQIEGEGLSQEISHEYLLKIAETKILPLTSATNRSLAVRCGEWILRTLRKMFH
jgi:serine/threonine protein kinase